MWEYVVELSKYFINFAIILYTLVSFYALRFNREADRRIVCILQNGLMFAVLILCFVNLIVVSEEPQYLYLFGFTMVFLFAAITLIPMIYENINRFLLNCMCMLLGIGLCMVSRLSFEKAIRQYIIILGSLMISMFIPFFIEKCHFFKKLTWLYAAVGASLLFTVLILGEVTHDSRISFSIAGITFQPSEFVKILFIFFLAGMLWEKANLPNVAITAVVAGVHVLVLVASKDLGSALIFFVAYVLIVFIASRNYLYLLAGIAGGSGAAYVAYRLFTHVQTRVLAWRDPWSYIDNQGYQITQSLFAVGSGSWFGMGLLKGNPTAIPYVDKDFIFSSICEELGVLFGVCLILICAGCFLHIMQISARISDRFYQLIVYGIGIMYIFQIFLTVGGGIKFIPLTGVTLPFISYGGSSIMSTMFMFFIIQGIYIRLQQHESIKWSRRKKSRE